MPERRPLDSTAIYLTVFLCFIWALQQIGIKATGDDMAPLMQVGVRSLGSAALIWLANRFWLKEVWNPAVKTWHGLTVGVLFSFEFFFVAEGLRLAPSSHMAVLLYTAPLFAAIGLTLTIPQERLNKKAWFGIILAFLGVGLALGFAESDPVNAKSVWLGDIFGLLAGFSWGMTTVWIRNSTINESSPTQMTFWLVVTSGVLLPLAALWMGETHMAWTPIASLNMAFQIVVVSFWSYVAWSWLLTRYLASRLGALSFLTPIFAIALSVILLNEPLSWQFIVGAVGVLIGVILVQSR